MGAFQVKCGAGLLFWDASRPGLTAILGQTKCRGTIRMVVEKGTVTHPSILAWRIPWQRSLVGYSPWGRKVSDTTERHTHTHTHTHTVAQLSLSRLSDTHTHPPSGSVESQCWVLQAQSRLVRLVTWKESMKAKWYFATVTWLSILLTIRLSFLTNLCSELLSLFLFYILSSKLILS